MRENGFEKKSVSQKNAHQCCKLNRNPDATSQLWISSQCLLSSLCTLHVDCIFFPKNIIFFGCLELFGMIASSLDLST